MVVSIADANRLWIRVYILLQMRNSNRNPWTDAGSKFEDPHVSATELNCEAGERKWSLRASFWFEIATMCLTNHSNSNVDDQGVIHLPDGRLSWHKTDIQC